MNLNYLITLVQRWKNKIFIYLSVLAVVTAIILYIKPNEYYSYTSAIPTNSSLSDKGYIFNEKIDGLYSSLGSYGDLDRLYSIAILDTSYKYLIHKYNLLNHYKIHAKNENIAVQKAIDFMSEDNLRIEKTENGLLRIHVMDISADTAAIMANDLMNYVENVNSNLQKEYNKSNLKTIDSNLTTLAKEYEQLKLLGSSELNQIAIGNKINQIQNLQKIKGQFETALQFQQPSLRVVEKATPCYKHLKPKRLYSFLSTMLLGLVAFVVIVMILESINTYKK